MISRVSGLRFLEYPDQCFFSRIVDGNGDVFGSDSGNNETTFSPKFFAPSARIYGNLENIWVGEGYKLRGSGGGSPQENFEVFCP